MGAAPNQGPFVPNIQNPRQFTTEFYGFLFETHPVDTGYTLSAGVVTAIGSNRGQRISATVVNTGANGVAISFTQNVTITTGIYLLQGGSFILQAYYDGDLLMRQLYAVAATGGTTLYILENVLAGG